jgi:predicted ATP-dependent Lon-type protease
MPFARLKYRPLGMTCLHLDYGFIVDYLAEILMSYKKIEQMSIQKYFELSDNYYYKR